MKKLLLLLIASGSFCRLAAQKEGDPATPIYLKRFVSTIPIRCALRDLNIGYGQQVGSNYTLEGRAGWVYPNKILHEPYERWLTSTEMLFQGPSFYLQLNDWNLKKKRVNIFFGFIAGYRYLWYHDKNLYVADSDGASYSEELTLSQWRNDFLLLGSIGLATTKFTTSELSLGVRIMHTHTQISATSRVNFANQELQGEYIASVLEKVPNDKGFGIMPLIRITSRFGWFDW